MPDPFLELQVKTQQGWCDQYGHPHGKIIRTTKGTYCTHCQRMIDLYAK
jgi:hypothetical protein